MDNWTATLVNNTDYPSGIRFSDVQEISEFIARYYRGEPGDLYSERWRVEGDCPDEIFDILEPPCAEGDKNWRARR